VIGDGAIRLQKYIARSGRASRRGAERMIEAGRVTVNGATVTEQGVSVLPGDRVAVDGKLLAVRDPILYLAIHKPRGWVCSSIPQENFPSFLALLPERLNRVRHVGRLDVGSEGLLLASDDGDFIQRVSHPSFGVRKRYEVRTQGPLNPELPQWTRAGIKQGRDRLRFEDLQVLHGHPERGKLLITLVGGKNREIRRLLETFHVRVVRLKRIGIGPVNLGELPCGQWRYLSMTERRSLLSEP